MTITRKIVLDEQGEPTEVIIPYHQFLEILEALGLDLNVSEQNDLREAIRDSRSKRREHFLAAAEV